MFKIFVTVLLVFVCLPAVAHDITQDECHAPVRPVDDQNDLLWQEFLDAIDAFRECTNRHMEWHQQAVSAHQAQARGAVEQWNEFVRTSLNAPQDFPWPPEEAE